MSLLVQALFYQLRTSKEDFSVIKRQHQAQLAKYASRQSAESSTGSQPHSSAAPDSNVKTEDSTPAAASATSTTPAESANPNPNPMPNVVPPNLPTAPRQPWEHVEEVLNLLKTAFPLLALSMEKMVDQIQTRGKPPPEEDIYRFITALLMDGMSVSRPSRQVVSRSRR